MIYQRTIARSVALSGLGLHSGSEVHMNLHPAAADTGIRFRRSDGERTVIIEAHSANVVDTRMATVLGKAGLSVGTVEHFLAALAGCGVDNLLVDIDGPEVPILDGSARPFVTLLQQTGVRRLSATRRYLAVCKPVSLVDGEKRASIVPSRFFRVTCDIAFDHPAISVQSRSLRFSPENFRREIAPARTFGFLHEVEYLQSQGLARGGSLENAVVFDRQGLLNPEGLRFGDEMVRHKILDAVGDLSLIGFPVLGHLKAFKAGHDLHHRLVSKLLDSPDCWRLVEFPPEAVQATTLPRPAALASNFR